jgi:GNAT superfamily N-acetyltransferase
MIRRCYDHHFELIWEIIDDGARAYKGIIPEDCWTEPYMSRAELQHEIDEGVAFWGYEVTGTLAGVMGLQQVRDVTLIRHTYVQTSHQKRGIGTKSKHLRVLSDAGLVGVRADAQRRIYALQPAPLKELEAWLERYPRIWEDNFQRLDKLRDEPKTKEKRSPRTKR